MARRVPPVLFVAKKIVTNKKPDGLLTSQISNAEKVYAFSRWISFGDNVLPKLKRASNWLFPEVPSFFSRIPFLLLSFPKIMKFLYHSYIATDYVHFMASLMLKEHSLQGASETFPKKNLPHGNLLQVPLWGTLEVWNFFVRSQITQGFQAYKGVGTKDVTIVSSK